MAQWHNANVRWAVDNWNFCVFEQCLFSAKSWFQTKQEVQVCQVVLNTWHLAHHNRKEEEPEWPLDDPGSWFGVKQPLQQESAGHMEKCTYWVPGSYLDK